MMVAIVVSINRENFSRDQLTVHVLVDNHNELEDLELTSEEEQRIGAVKVSADVDFFLDEDNDNLLAA